jgi:hypothetical protein
MREKMVNLSSSVMVIFDCSLLNIIQEITCIFTVIYPSVNTRNTITIRHQVYERLKRHGVFGESFSKLITRILDELEEAGNRIG